MSSPTYDRRPERVQAMQLNGAKSYPAIAGWVRSLGGEATIHEHRLTIDRPGYCGPGKDEWVVWFPDVGDHGWFEVWSARRFEATFVRAGQGRKRAAPRPGRVAAVREVEALLRRVDGVMDEDEDDGPLRFTMPTDRPGQGTSLSPAELASLVVDRVLGAEQDGPDR